MLAARSGRRYDPSMTTATIAISIERAHLEKVHEAVRVGRAESISAYIGRAIERQAREDSLREIVRDLATEHGEPSAKDKEWAKRVLRRRKA
jgi:hypothetical protein